MLTSLVNTCAAQLLGDSTLPITHVFNSAQPFALLTPEFKFENRGYFSKDLDHVYRLVQQLHCC